MRTALTNSLIGIGVAIIVVATWKIVTPMIEGRLIRPVVSLQFDSFTCIGPDVLAEGVLDKNRWPGGASPEFGGMSIYALAPEGAPAPRLAWRDVDLGDRSAKDRPPGLQEIRIVITGGCDRPFTAHTVHYSPWTLAKLPMRFGPFNQGTTQ